MIRLERRSVLLAVACCSLLQSSCGGGDGPAAPEVKVPTSLTASSSTSLTGTAGQPVTPLPSVIVKDQHGDAMAGVLVTFAVTSGAGSIAGESATTDASGVATVGGWTLGRTSGSNTLTATVGQLGPVTFTANGAPGAPAVMTKTAGDGQTAVAGSGVLTAPAVTITDVNGNGVPSIAVTFSMASGAGTVVGGHATTNSAGVAAPTEWILGKTPGSNSVRATAAGLPAVTFSATAIVGPPATVTALVDVDGAGYGGYTLLEAPLAEVKDANG